MGPSVSGERGIALKDISGCRACPEDVSTWRKCKRDPVLAVPLSLPRGAYCWERFPSPAGRVRLCQLQCLVFSPSAGIPSTCTLICFGLTSALLGRVIRSMPLRHSAVAFSVSTVDGTVQGRLNGP